MALLGTRRDREVASLIGRTTAAVRRKRELLGIAPFVARWREDEITVLGTDTDRAVVERLGRTESAVVTKRGGLGIPAFRNRLAAGLTQRRTRPNLSPTPQCRRSLDDGRDGRR